VSTAGRVPAYARDGVVTDIVTPSAAPPANAISSVAISQPPIPVPGGRSIACVPHDASADAGQKPDAGVGGDHRQDRRAGPPPRTHVAGRRALRVRHHGGHRLTVP
jgi:hypothetical protein